MADVHETLVNFNTDPNRPKEEFIDAIEGALVAADYNVVERDDSRPWGAFLRLDNNDADRFVAEFFPGTDPVEARLGNIKLELSPKILVTQPGQQLSWQYHDRRAERWAFLNGGAYYKSKNDVPGDRIEVDPGQVVQFEQGERHRLVGALGHYTLVAEIWQHTDSEHPSDEDDIIRLQDDYRR